MSIWDTEEPFPVFLFSCFQNVFSFVQFNPREEFHIPSSSKNNSGQNLKFSPSVSFTSVQSIIDLWKNILTHPCHNSFRSFYPPMSFLSIPLYPLQNITIDVPYFQPPPHTPPTLKSFILKININIQNPIQIS